MLYRYARWHAVNVNTGRDVACNVFTMAGEKQVLRRAPSQSSIAQLRMTKHS